MIQASRILIAGYHSELADHPALHLPLPSSESVAVGNVMVGPTSEISLPELAGERNSVGLMSPSPKALRIPGRRRLVDDGHDDPRDKVPVFVQGDRNRGLKSELPEMSGSALRCATSACSSPPRTVSLIGLRSNSDLLSGLIRSAHWMCDPAPTPTLGEA